MVLSAFDINAYLQAVRGLVLAELQRRLPTEGPASALYGLVLDYPLRAAKALRPALCVATCRALGGSLAAALPSATALELYHNAFLIHDDIEDASETRRGQPTLHRAHGVPTAINVGDAMLALALAPLLENTATMGLGPALRSLETVAEMARISAEGQAVELAWVRGAVWQVEDVDYLAMIEQKTAQYTFVAPMQLGAHAARATPEQVAALSAFARVLGLGFQIRDDLLNLIGDPDEVGKEPAGDLWEGKRTLMLLHLMRHLSKRDAARAKAILGRARPGQVQGRGLQRMVEEIELLSAQGLLPDQARARLLARAGAAGAVKTQADIDWLLAQLHARGSIAYAQTIADRYAEEAAERLAALDWLAPSEHRAFLEGLVAYAVARAT
jgi:geranylgeranyl diphosphate synthase type II